MEPYGLKVDTGYGLVWVSPKREFYAVRMEGDPEDADAVALSEEVVGTNFDLRPEASTYLDRCEGGQLLGVC